MTAERIREILAMPIHERPQLKMLYIPNDRLREAIEEFNEDDEYEWDTGYRHVVKTKAVSPYMSRIGCSDAHWRHSVDPCESDRWEEVVQQDAIDIIRRRT